MLIALAVAMLLPAAADLYVGNRDWQAFALSSALTLACGDMLLYATRCRLQGGLTLRQAFVLTPVSWSAVALFGALPLAFSDYGTLKDSFTNAFFESMSGLTATGATVIIGLDAAPPGLLLWRALLQWLGGIGIIGVAIAILPALGIGGMQLFRTESSDRSEKVMPRARQIAAAIGVIYAGLTLVCAVLYWLAGMTAFEAVVHALTTLATGGFSTSDISMSRWDIPALHWIAIVFIVGLAAWLFATDRHGLLDSLRHAAFNVVSVVTTTGFATTDYSRWGNIAVGVFFGLTFIGACTGSTSGGIKIFRFEVMAVLLRTHFLHLLHPKGVFPRSYAGRLLPDDVVTSVVVFFALYFLCYSVLTIALMTLDLDFVTSITAAVSALSNVGPGLGPIIGPVGTFAPLPDTAKWLLTFAMLLGRLELFTVLILFMPRFWRG
jgi:trk system potassium uptake protein TrkH